MKTVAKSLKTHRNGCGHNTLTMKDWFVILIACCCILEAQRCTFTGCFHEGKTGRSSCPWGGAFSVGYLIVWSVCVLYFLHIRFKNSFLKQSTKPKTRRTVHDTLIYLTLFSMFIATTSMPPASRGGGQHWGQGSQRLSSTSSCIFHQVHQQHAASPLASTAPDHRHDCCANLD